MNIPARSPLPLSKLYPTLAPAPVHSLGVLMHPNKAIGAHVTWDLLSLCCRCPQAASTPYLTSSDVF